MRGESFCRVVLTEGRRETFVQIRIEAFDGADDGDLGSFGRREA
jgi:hypothetical protein